VTAGRELHYFAMLSREEQREAIHRLANAGMSDYTIAAATKLSVEMVRIILAQVPGR
jgi:2-iminoacetate synthase ThiH